jgi:HAD superfamily hydrolase (TIGR01450 family)
MARRLLDAGEDLTVWNRTPEKAQPLISAGAKSAPTPAEAASGAEVVITMVTDPGALVAVTRGADGVASGIGAQATMIEMSTVGPAAVAELASALPAGTGLLDAPVLGSLTEAETGTLKIYVGGETDVVERVTPLLSILGSPIHVGDLGSGAVAKLVANATLFNSLGSLGEALALADGLGLSREMTYQILASTPLSAQAERRREGIETSSYPPRFPLALAAKDADLVEDAARASGLDLPLTHAARAWLVKAEIEGSALRDYSSVLETIIGSAEAGVAHPARTGPASGSGAGFVDLDGLIVDLDGVVWRGDQPIPGAAEAVSAIRARDVRVVFMTNEPAFTREALAARLTEMGIPVGANDVITSAAAAARVAGDLDGLVRRTALVVGPRTLHDEIAGQRFELVATDRAREAEVVVVGGHEGFDYEELRAAAAAIAGGARLIATGRDVSYPAADGPRPATGAILAAIEAAAGVRGVVVGKPERVMFDLARRALAGCERPGVVGDNLTADIAGAKGAGMLAILVLTGTSKLEDLDRSTTEPDLVLGSIAELPSALTS